MSNKAKAAHDDARGRGKKAKTVFRNSGTTFGYRYIVHADHPRFAVSLTRRGDIGS